MKHPHSFPCRLSRGFTLIELLVVVTIIGILVSLAVPATSMALDAAKRAEAAAFMSSMRTAMVGYSGEYGDWPPALASFTNTQGDAFVGPNTGWSSVYQVLAAVTNDTNLVFSNNRRQLVFMEFPPKTLTAQTYTMGAALIGNETNPVSVINVLDPWGRPYFMVVDYNYDNLVYVPNLSSTNTNANTVLRSSIAIWSTGKNPSSPSSGKWVGTWK
jgi:prepilin-type N-terminal cleavage/methylation domain-containing protein